ncbi:MAG: macro domain-containing protein [Proteobacteria bacterium]|nr:macro domain-containing protein [Pseudomonadota bacterium]
MKAQVNRTGIEIVQGDITDMDTTAIVNAANDRLILGAGVAGAIRIKGGPAIQEECNRLGGTYVGGAVVTGAGRLKARYVIHAVGPRMGEGNEDQKLRSATKNSLLRAEEKQMASIAFPAISTGIFGFPVDRAARIMLETAREHAVGTSVLERIVFCLYGQEAYDVFASEFRRQFPGA